MSRQPFTSHELCKALRQGCFAWPGGYPLYFIAEDGEALSFEAVKENLKHVLWSMRGRYFDTQWAIAGIYINYEDTNLFCAHTGKRIESAYAEDEADTFHLADRTLSYCLLSKKAHAKTEEN
jgi:hypothetical protein